MDNCFFHIPDSVLQPHMQSLQSMQMLNPFAAEPHPLCLWAANQLLSEAASRSDWTQELAKGKMMGVMIVADRTADGVRYGYLKAYSGQILGRSDWQGYVPAVFNFLQPDGYFKQHEAQIDALNSEIVSLEQSDEHRSLQTQLLKAEQHYAENVAAMRRQAACNKQKRDEQRQNHPDDTAILNRLIAESQYEKAEMRRRKQQMKSDAERIKEALNRCEAHILQLKQQRHAASDSLQRWLFEHFIMTNVNKEQRNLLEIFYDYNRQLPPAGTGECCAPKLLQYAFAHNLRPLALAEVWCGESPRGELRRHGWFYPPCRGKCYPLLRWMLQSNFTGVASCDTPTSFFSNEYPKSTPVILYEDESIIVVDKPTGMASVRGLATQLSLEQWLENRNHPMGKIYMVHRLDMDTSGIIVAAKTRQAHKHLQQQFAGHTIKKRYTALVCGTIPQPKGIISLPLRPDYFDRPRQMVDHSSGKPATTRYETAWSNGQTTRLHLFPTTGRTHQLRVHCAHPQGLNAPICGDRLYGKAGDRLCLHADTLSFCHPVSHKQLTFSSPAPF